MVQRNGRVRNGRTVDSGVKGQPCALAIGERVEQWIVLDTLGMRRQLGVITHEEMADADEPDMATPAP